MTPADFDAYTFDCYGTLIDWERGILDILQPWADRSALGIDEDALLEAFASIEPAVEHEHPTMLYPDVLRLVHCRIAADARQLAYSSSSEFDVRRASANLMRPSLRFVNRRALGA